MSQPKISIVIPVYGAEKYLSRCVDSILAQSYQDFELILVDDESPDRCGEICDEYAKKNDRIIVIHQKNTRGHIARLNGVHAAHGEWVTFVDDDDALPPDALENLASKAHNGTDLVIGFLIAPHKKRNLTLEESRAAIFTRYISGSVWGKMYRRTCLSDEIFNIPSVPPMDYFMNIKYLFQIDRDPEFVFRGVYKYYRISTSEVHTTKSSLDSEMTADDVISQCMTKEQHNLYLKSITNARINGIFGTALRQPEEIIKRHPYLDRIERGIETSGYRLKLTERLILRSKSKALIKFGAWLHIIPRALRYRISILFYN